MPPRKSSSRSSRTSRAADQATVSQPDPAPSSSSRAVLSPGLPPQPMTQPQPQPTASSSKITLEDLPALEAVPESITYDYVSRATRDGRPNAPQVLDEEAQERLIHELLNFAPRSLLEDIADHAHIAAYAVINGVEQWARAVTEGKGEEYSRELDIGMHAFESLIESHVDKAFDMFTAYALRNTFKVPDDLELVMPWHRGIDFERGKFVTELPGGEDTLVQRLDALQKRLDKARLVQNRLAIAEAELDRRLEIAAHRKAEVGFVNDAVTSAGLSPLPEKAAVIAKTLTSLHEKLRPLEPIQPSAVPPIRGLGAGTKAWEMGRQAYLNWAVEKALSSSTRLPGGTGAPGPVGEDRLEAVEREMKAVGSGEDMEELLKHL